MASARGVITTIAPNAARTGARSPSSSKSVLSSLCPRRAAADAHELARIDDAESAIRQHHEEIGVVRHEEKMIGCGDRHRAPIRQLNFEWLEWRGIAHFPQCLEPHDPNRLSSLDCAVNVAELSRRFARTVSHCPAASAQAAWVPARAAWAPTARARTERRGRCGTRHCSRRTRREEKNSSSAAADPARQIGRDPSDRPIHAMRCYVLVVPNLKAPGPKQELANRAV